MATGVTNIFDYKLGTVVLNSNHKTEKGQLIDMYGHITGFSINALDEVVLIVKWANQDVSSIHPAVVHLKAWR